MLRGRELECARLDGLLDAARSGLSSALLIRGDPGVGKSALLNYALDRATGMTAVVTRGIESESELPFAGLGDIVHPLRSALTRIPPVQEAVLAGAVAIGPPTGGDRFAVYAATLSLLASAAESNPLLVVVDDIQWLDTGSAEALLFAARRMSSDSVLLLVALRAGEPTTLDLSGLPILETTGLSEFASVQVLGDRPDAPVAPRVAVALHIATQGNPLALIEVPNLLSEAQRAGVEALPDPLPSGPRLEHAFLRRVAALPAETRSALLLAAASDSTDVAPIRQAMELNEIAANALEAAESAGLITVDGADLRFSHPLIRSAVYQSASPVDRRDAHRAIAQVLKAEPTAGRRAWHLAAAADKPDESVAKGLEETASRSMARSGYAASAKAFARAARLTPEAGDRARRLERAAHAFHLGGLHEAALRCLDEATPLVSGDRGHSEIQRMRAVIEMWVRAPMAAHELLLAEAERVLPNDPPAAAELMAEAVGPCFMAGQVSLGLATAKRAYALTELASSEKPLLVCVMLAGAMINSGDCIAAEQLLNESLGRAAGAGAEAARTSATTLLACLIDVERYEEARQFIAGALTNARSAGAIALLPYLLAVLTEIEFRTGNWSAAYASGTESVRLANETGQLSESSYSLACLARVEAAQGRDADCKEHVRAALEIARSHGTGSIFAYAGTALGALELGRGRPGAALVHLEEVARFTQARGLGEPNVVQWQGDLIESLARAGKTGEAFSALELLEKQAKHTERIWALATAARCRGFMTDEPHFESHFIRALAFHRLKPAPFEIARTELCYGETLRRHRRRIEARQRLREALFVFERLGAEPWANRARVELAATGERSRKRDVAASRHLTPQELQIALAVAGGATNREAAAHLFLSPKTVEAHLSAVYAKLGVRSRSELANVFAREHGTEAFASAGLAKH